MPPKLRPALAPYGDDAADVGLDLLGNGVERVRRQQLHRAGTAQGCKAGVDLSRDAARHRARPPVRGPEALFGVLLRQILEDGEAVPNRQILVEQQRHEPRGAVFADLRLRFRQAQSNVNLLERQPEAPHGKPGPQAPARPVFIADDQSVAIRGHALALPSVILSCAPRWCPDRESPAIIRYHLAQRDMADFSIITLVGQTTMTIDAPLGHGLPAASTRI